MGRGRHGRLPGGPCRIGRAVDCRRRNGKTIVPPPIRGEDQPIERFDAIGRLCIWRSRVVTVLVVLSGVCVVESCNP